MYIYISARIARRADSPSQRSPSQRSRAQRSASQADAQPPADVFSPRGAALPRGGHVLSRARRVSLFFSRENSLLLLLRERFLREHAARRPLTSRRRLGTSTNVSTEVARPRAARPRPTRALLRRRRLPPPTLDRARPLSSAIDRARQLSSAIDRARPLSSAIERPRPSASLDEHLTRSKRARPRRWARPRPTTPLAAPPRGQPRTRAHPRTPSCADSCRSLRVAITPPP